MLRWAFFALPFQIRQCRRSTSATIVAFAVVVAYPYIPGSNSEAFTLLDALGLPFARDGRPKQYESLNAGEPVAA